MGSTTLISSLSSFPSSSSSSFRVSSTRAATNAERHSTSISPAPLRRMGGQRRGADSCRLGGEGPEGDVVGLMLGLEGGGGAGPREAVATAAGKGLVASELQTQERSGGGVQGCGRPSFDGLVQKGFEDGQGSGLMAGGGRGSGSDGVEALAETRRAEAGDELIGVEGAGGRREAMELVVGRLVDLETHEEEGGMLPLSVSWVWSHGR